jgi:thiol-disulfide isomerase/thioredoxin
MRRGGAGLIAVVLALAGCKTTDPKSADKKSDREPAASAASRTKDKPSWLDDMNRQPGANTGVPKADSWADPKDPNFNVASEVKGVLAGRVLDPTGRGAKSVFIRIEAADARPSDKAGAATGILTDANGYFMVRGLKPGQSYNLTAEAQWEGKPLYGIVQAKTPNATLSIPLREDLGVPPAGPPRGGNTAPPATAFPPAPAPADKLPPPEELIPRSDMPMPTTPPRPTEEAWNPGGGPSTRGVPPSISAPRGNNPAPALPPASPVDVPRSPIPERTADAPKDPRWPPPASIPGPVVPPSPPVPPLPPPPKEGGDGKTMSRPRPAGNFTLLDTMERPWDFAGSRSGSLVLLEFMTTTCVHCKPMIPYLTDIQSRYGASGLEVIAVTCDDGPVSERIALARRYHQDNHLNYSLYVEPGNVPGQVRDRFGIEGYPTVVLLDAAGAVLWKGHPGNRAELEDAIRRNLGK